MTPEQRSLRGRLGAYAALARHDASEINAKARATYRASFREGHGCKVCPPFSMPAGLSEAEVERRADALRRLHYGRLAARSSEVRARRKRSAK